MSMNCAFFLFLSTAGKEVKEPGEKAKEESEGSMLKGKAHTTETHGTSSDVDENTPIDKVKGPNVFERAMEEIEAIVEAIHPRRKDWFKLAVEEKQNLGAISCNKSLRNPVPFWIRIKSAKA